MVSGPGDHAADEGAKVIAKIFIARHERHEAAEVYASRLSQTQIEYLKENEGDFWLETDSEAHRAVLWLIEDEG